MGIRVVRVINDCDVLGCEAERTREKRRGGGRSKEVREA